MEQAVIWVRHRQTGRVSKVTHPDTIARVLADAVTYEVVPDPAEAPIAEAPTPTAPPAPAVAEITAQQTAAVAKRNASARKWIASK